VLENWAKATAKRFRTSPTNQSFSKLPKICDILFLRGQRLHEMPTWFDQNSLKIHFGYLGDIQTQKGGSGTRICPFYLSKAAYLGTPIWHQAKKSDRVHVSVWYLHQFQKFRKLWLSQYIFNLEKNGGPQHIVPAVFSFNEDYRLNITPDCW